MKRKDLLKAKKYQCECMTAVDAYQQSKMIVKDLTEPKQSKEIVKTIKDYDSVSILCPECNWM